MSALCGKRTFTIREGWVAGRHEGAERGFANRDRLCALIVFRASRAGIEAGLQSLEQFRSHQPMPSTRLKNLPGVDRYVILRSAQVRFGSLAATL